MVLQSTLFARLITCARVAREKEAPTKRKRYMFVSFTIVYMFVFLRFAIS